MKQTGAWLAVRALEQIGVRWVFGMPGVHVTELYDELGNSEQITPVLVTHEGAAAFMADALSRTGQGLGTLAVVPGAGITQALSGICEAYLAGIPLLVIAGGIRRDSGRAYQLHDVDQQAMLAPVTKGRWLVRDHANVVPTLYEAARLALSGEPGPVVVELPAELLLFAGECGPVPHWQPALPAPEPDAKLIERAVELLRESERPGLYLGWGAVGAVEEARRIAEALEAPVATTLQGLSAFPGDHPLHAGMGFGPCGTPPARWAFSRCDALLAVGCRFSELATGSYSLPVPEQLIHVDINPQVFDRNYPAKLAIAGDARAVLGAIAQRLGHEKRSERGVADRLAREKYRHLEAWLAQPERGRVRPAPFFRALRETLPREALLVCDDGNHTFLTAELMPILRARGFLSPSDFNCMGYAVPAAIGAKLANPQLPVAVIVGDGALRMTGLELVTAAARRLGIVVFVFQDGELGQIAQFQELPLKRKTCTVLPPLDLEGLAAATGAGFVEIADDGAIASGLTRAFAGAAAGKPMLVSVQIDYARRTSFTRGVMQANLGRMPLAEKTRFVGRALMRRLV